MKKVMAVVSAEPVFSERFCTYTNASGSFLLRAKPFSTVESFLVYRKEHGPGSVPVLLCDEELYALSRGFDFSGTAVFLLSETGKEGTLSKYQSGASLLQGVFSLCAERNVAVPLATAGKEMPLYAVWGGNSLERQLFSLALTRLLSHRKKTVYLDLREFSGLRCLTGKNYDRGLSTAVYYLKQGKLDGQRLMGLLEDYEGISYLPPVAYSEDAGVMSPEDRDEIFRMLAEESPVECLVADLPDSLAASTEILERSEKIFLAVTNDPVERESAAVFREMLRVSGREDLLGKIVETDMDKTQECLLKNGIDGVIYSETGDRVRRLLEI